MGFIENNKAECMISVLINTHLLMAQNKIMQKNFFLVLVLVFTILVCKIKIL